jgi:hypothetical protein
MSWGTKMQTNNKRHNDESKLNLLPELNDNEFDLLLTSIGCALQKCDQLDNGKQRELIKQVLLEKELLDLYNNIQINSIETDSYVRMDGC